MSAHDNEARIASDAILNQIRAGNPNWLNPFVSNQAHYVESTKKFPSPDRSFFCPDLYTRIALEFKPAIRESKGGILRGLGQSMAYLMEHPDTNKKINDASYLVMPEEIEGFAIGDYLESIFNEFIVGTHPIGLITFNISDPSLVKLRCNISNNLISLYQVNYNKAIQEGKKASEAHEVARKKSYKDKNAGSTTYWAAWRENYPHDTYYLLETALKNKSVGTVRVKEIWESFYYSYYCYPPSARNTLKSLPNKLYVWEEKSNKFVNQYWLQDVKKSLRESVNRGDDSLNDALDRIKWASSKDEQERSVYWDATQRLSVRKPKLTKAGNPSSDNDFNTIKKNRKNGMVHTGLIDKDTFEVSDLGKGYVRIFKKNQDPTGALATLYIGSGKWDELIQDILTYQQDDANVIPENVSEYRDQLKDFFISKGLIGLNRERKSNNAKERPFLTSETQTLKRFSIYEGFEPQKGFKFNLSNLRKYKNDFKAFFDTRTRLLDSLDKLNEEELLELEDFVDRMVRN